jgi:asparagine synthase (glutamine-hydrolysing)
MCGLCGQVDPRGVGAEGLRRMLGQLAHRGPDDEDLHLEAEAGLGHRRLSIIDLEGGRQPIPNEDETVWIVLNGEIYNYRELRSELVLKGHRFRTHSDTEVIVHLYEEYGTACVERLRGMFAFAIWDAPRRRLFAARDHLGQKPFFYARDGASFAFASEIKALLALDRGLAEPDPQALDQYLALRVILPPLTMFRRIRKLPPAHWLCFEPDKGLRIERYWDLEYEPKLTGTDDELVDELEAQMIECLRLHMVADVPVGAFLSGGLDSTLVVALLMRHVLDEPLMTFSGSLAYGSWDEAPYARMVAERYGTRHYERPIQPSLLRTLPQLVWHLDEPADPLAVCSYLIAEIAREHVKVALGGDGGDELFGGYDRYYGNRMADSYARVPEALRRHAIGPLLDRVPDGSWYKSRGHQLKWMHALSFLKGGARYARSLSYFYFSPEQRGQLYTTALARAVGDFDAEAPIRQAYERARAEDAVDRMLYADSQLRLPDHSVMILDRMTMAHGLEARSPFLDPELASFAARLPPRMKVRGRSLRWIQQRLAERYLPKEVLERPKQGFSVALPYMLRDEYRQLFDAFLRPSRLAEADLLRQAEIDRLLAVHAAGRADHGNRLWLLLNAEVWYRLCVGGASVADLTEEAGQAASLPQAGSGA